MIIIDIILVNIALYFSFWIRWDGLIPFEIKTIYKNMIVFFTFGNIIFFYLFDLYTWSFKFAGLCEAIRICKAVVISSIIFVSCIFFLNLQNQIGRAVPVIEMLLCLFLIGGFRFFLRLLKNLNLKSQKNSFMKRVLIYGAGISGESIVRELLNSSKENYYPIGFIDDDANRKGQTINGVKVLGNKDELTKIVEDYKIDEIIIAISSANGKTIRNIINSCEKSTVCFKIMPGLQDIISGKVEMNKIRNVKPEDLLGREMIQTDASEIESYIQNKSVLITGAAGSIGSELVMQISKYKPERLILLDINENASFFLENTIKKTFPSLKLHVFIGDIKDIGLLKYIFSNFNPNILFHAAAHKHVPLMEANPAAAIKNNILGTRNLIYAADHYKVERFILISTDKAVNPTSVMGTTKRVTEMLLQAKAKISKTKYMSVRFGNVLGSNGSVIQIFKKQIKQGGPITLTHPDIRRYFMSVSEAVSLVLQAGALGNGGEIFILDMGEQVKIIDLAKNLITLSGLELDKDISIEITGLRPGEKLYEEMLHNAEHDLATKHNKIFVAQPDNYDTKQINQDIDELRKFSKMMMNKKIIQKLREMVPSYTPTE